MGRFGIVLGQVTVCQAQVGPMVELCQWEYTGFELRPEFPVFR